SKCATHGSDSPSATHVETTTHLHAKAPPPERSDSATHQNANLRSTNDASRWRRNTRTTEVFLRSYRQARFAHGSDVPQQSAQGEPSDATVHWSGVEGL